MHLVHGKNQKHHMWSWQTQSHWDHSMDSVGHPPLGGINIKSTSCKKKYLQVWLKWWWKYSGQIHMLLRHMDGDEQDTLRKQKRSKWTRWCYTTKHLSAPAVWSDDYTGTADSSMHQTAKSCIWRYQASNILASLSTGRGKTGKKGSTTRGNQGLMQFMLYVDSEKSACACKT